MNRLDLEALPSIRETEREREAEREKREGAKDGKMKRRQRKRSMEGTNINSSVLISLSSPKRQQPLQGHPPITSQTAPALPLEHTSTN